MEHHILLLDINCERALVTCTLKQKQHRGAKIYTKSTIETHKPVFSPASKGWRLHIINHGVGLVKEDLKKIGMTNKDIQQAWKSDGSSYFQDSAVTTSDVARLIKTSGLPDSKDASVQLQVCYAGYGDYSLARSIKAELQQKQNYGPKCNITVWGCVGVLIPSWDQLDPSVTKVKSGRRLILDPTKMSEYMTETGKVVWQKGLKSTIETLAKSVKEGDSPATLEKKAKKVADSSWRYHGEFYKAAMKLALDKQNTRYKKGF